MGIRDWWLPAPPDPSTRGPESASGLAKTIAGGALNYGLGQSLPLITGLLLVPLYTAVLTPKDYGIVEMMAVSGTLLGVLARLGIPGAVTRYYYDHPEGPELRNYVTSIAWALRISACVVGGLALIVAWFFLDDLSPDLAFFPYAPLAVLAMIFTANSELQRRLVQVRRQSAYSARLSLLNSSVAIGLTILLVLVFRLGATGMMLAQVLTAALFLANATAYLWPDLQGEVKPASIRESLRFGRGIFTSHLMAAGGPFVSRALLAASASIGALGLYSLATRVTSPLSILGNAFATAYTPEYFAARKDGTVAARAAVAKVEAGIWSLAVVGALGAAVVGPPTVRLLTPERFHSAATLVPILAIGFLGQVMYALVSPEMFYLKRRWLPPIVTTANIATTIALTLLLVRDFGAVGVAWASVAGTLTGSFVCALVARRKAPIPHDWSGLVRAPILAIASGVVLLSMAPSSPVIAVVTGVATVVANALILFLVGDPAMRRIASAIRARISRPNAVTP